MKPTMPATPKRERPSLNDKEFAWTGAFDKVLAKMVEASGQPDDKLVRVDFVTTAAEVAAQLVAGTEY